MRTRCKKCGTLGYYRDDGKFMVRVWGTYDGEFDWRDKPHKKCQTKKSKYGVSSDDPAKCNHCGKLLYKHPTKNCAGWL